MNVASRIIYLREQKGLTTNKLANMAGISQSHLREIELGLRNPTVETLSYFCDALGVTLEEFFREDDSEINPYLMSALTRFNDKEQMALADFLNTLKPWKIIKRKASELDGTLALFYHKPAKKTLPAETTAIENYIATSWK